MVWLIIIVILLVLVNYFFGDGHFITIFNDYTIELKALLYLLTAIFVFTAFLIFLKVIFNHFLSYKENDDNGESGSGNNEVKEKNRQPEAKTEVIEE